jgi:hypothetical protein
MDFRLTADQSALAEAIDKLAQQFEAKPTEFRGFALAGHELDKELEEGQYFDIAQVPELGALGAAMAVERLARVPFAAEFALSMLVRPQLPGEWPRPLAVVENGRPVLRDRTAWPSGDKSKDAADARASFPSHRASDACRRRCAWRSPEHAALRAPHRPDPRCPPLSMRASERRRRARRTRPCDGAALGRCRAAGRTACAGSDDRPPTPPRRARGRSPRMRERSAATCELGQLLLPIAATALRHPSIDPSDKRTTNRPPRHRPRSAAQGRCGHPR